MDEYCIGVHDSFTNGGGVSSEEGRERKRLNSDSAGKQIKWEVV